MLNIHQDLFTRRLPADNNISNRPRQVYDAAYSYVTPRTPSARKLLHVSADTLEMLGLDPSITQDPSFQSILSGASVVDGSKPYSMVYSGHQFGHWAGQLGDGRAINLGGITGKNDKEYILQLKGAGLTPYSRTADGLAVLRSSIREHLCSEAMHHLGIPTTRSLSLMLTGDQVMRDVMYDGHPAYEPGAVVCRVSPSFVRFGNFEHFAAHKKTDILQALADHIIDDYTDIKASGKDRYLALMDWVTDKTVDMIVHWQRVGFVHGVMNTDNLSILGLTIDYGPYGWLDNYDTEWTPNTTDRQGRRYRFGHQPRIAAWNLVKLANALYPLVGETAPLEAILQDYGQRFGKRYLRMMHDKLGLTEMTDDTVALVQGLDKHLMQTETDMTIWYRQLSAEQVPNMSANALCDHLGIARYADEISSEINAKWISWAESYLQLVKNARQDATARHKMMTASNPKYVLRNYMAQMAIEDAEKGNYSTIIELYDMLQRPYDENTTNEKWYAKRPDWARNKVGCSMLSCSS